MAKEDFCFTYYDGDAARDKAHMNRLQRGGYDDVVSAQRKRGHLSIKDLHRVLGADFDLCWEALEWVLQKDEEGKYFIDWLEISIQKMKRQAAKQSENGKRGGRPKNPNETQIETQTKANVNPKPIKNKSQEKPLEDEDGNEDVYGFKPKEVIEEKNWEQEKQKFIADGKWIFKFCNEKGISVDVFDKKAREFLSDLELKEDYKPIKEIRSHFTNWFNLKKSKNVEESPPGKAQSRREERDQRILDEVDQKPFKNGANKH